MPEKITYEFVKEQLEKEGYELLTKEYENCYQRLEYVCSNGHEHNIIWNSWQQGSRCPYCAGNIKLNIEFISAEFKKEGYILLIDEYINNKQKLDYICPNGHRHFTNWHNWNSNNNRCPYCADLIVTIEDIEESFERERYILLTTKYINNSQKLEYICPKGHKHFITWKNWCKGRRCPYCSGNAKKTIEFIRSEFEKEAYILLTIEYINSSQKLIYICPNGHEHVITWSNWQQGKRCPYCANNGKPTIEFILSGFEKEGYTLLTEEYKNAPQKLDCICPEGHEHTISWNSWQQGYRCLTCFFVKNSGSGHPNWKGGISCEPYCDIWLDKDFKKSIKERDSNKCQNPDCWGTSKRLTIHHIDYDKKNCRPENLITLCNSCNSRANKDREWHKSFYRIVMEKKNKIKKFVAGV